MLAAVFPTGTNLIPPRSDMARQAVDLVCEVTGDDELDNFLAELLYISEDESETVHGGSRPELASNIEHHRKRYALRLHQNYFFSCPKYHYHLFQPGFSE